MYLAWNRLCVVLYKTLQFGSRLFLCGLTSINAADLIQGIVVVSEVVVKKDLNKQLLCHLT